MLTGGVINTQNLFKNIKQRFYETTKQNYVVKNALCFEETLKNENTVWKGGALLSELPCCRNNWITKSEYLEDKNIVFRKNEYKINYRFS